MINTQHDERRTNITASEQLTSDHVTRDHVTRDYVTRYTNLFVNILFIYVFATDVCLMKLYNKGSMRYSPGGYPHTRKFENWQ